MNRDEEQYVRDSEHLKLLAIFHYIFAGLTALFGLFPLLYVALGVALATGTLDDSQTGKAPPEELGWIFAAFGGALVAFSLTLAGLMAYAGRSIMQRRRHTFVMVVAGLMCLFMPIGTVLGVFTIVVLSRDSVKRQFAAIQSV